MSATLKAFIYFYDLNLFHAPIKTHRKSAVNKKSKPSQKKVTQSTKSLYLQRLRFFLTWLLSFDMVGIMELYREKIEEIMEAHDITYQKIADILQIKHRQQVHAWVAERKAKHAKTLAKVFTDVLKVKVREQDLLKFDE